MTGTVLPEMLATLSVARSIAQFTGQTQLSKQTQKAAQASYDADIEALNERQDQERRVTVDQINKASREALQAKASARVTGAEQGISITTLLQDLSLQGSENIATLQKNFENGVKQIRRQARSSAATAQGIMNQAPRPSIGLSFTNAALDASSGYLSGLAIQKGLK